VLGLPLISVCIPIFNSDANSLVKKLTQQANILDSKIELIVIDDCSNLNWKLKNESIKNLCNYIELTENSGRSKIRNLFLNHAKGEFFLFIDGDSEIISDNFLMDYLNFIEKNNPEVIVGGSIYQTQRPTRSHFLRWNYSICRESKSAEKRENVNLGFKTNNFLIRKSVFAVTLFNETLSGYGHEDTLFGIQLAKYNCKIQHLENPVLNKHLDSNEVFLKKTENAIGNLVHIYKMKEQFPEIKEIKLIRFYEKITQQRLISIVSILFTLGKPVLFNFLTSGYFMLWMFDFYKLGLFIRKIKS
jgi:glycosyltransferase involved in cell wall biosynthesis